MVDIERLMAEIEAWKRYEWRGDFERTNYTLTMAREAADELLTLRALRDKVEAARLAWGVFDDDGALLSVDLNDQCELPPTGHVRCVRVMVPAGDTP